jgi:hypothetical protein
MPVFFRVFIRDEAIKRNELFHSAMSNLLALTEENVVGQQRLLVRLINIAEPRKFA